jgi:hypothetical protein
VAASVHADTPAQDKTVRIEQHLIHHSSGREPRACAPPELEEVPVPIVGGLDIHRKQITFDYLGTGTGQVQRGQVSPAGREHLRA